MQQFLSTTDGQTRVAVRPRWRSGWGGGEAGRRREFSSLIQMSSGAGKPAISSLFLCLGLAWKTLLWGRSGTVLLSSRYKVMFLIWQWFLWIAFNIIFPVLFSCWQLPHRERHYWSSSSMNDENKYKYWIPRVLAFVLFLQRVGVNNIVRLTADLNIHRVKLENVVGFGHIESATAFKWTAWYWSASSQF